MKTETKKLAKVSRRRRSLRMRRRQQIYHALTLGVALGVVHYLNRRDKLESELDRALARLEE